MTATQCRRIHSVSSCMDYMSRNPYKYREAWIREILSIAKDFCVADMDEVHKIIEETKNIYKGRERETLMYNYAHKKLMQII